MCLFYYNDLVFPDMYLFLFHMLILTSCTVVSLFPEGILELFFIYMLVYLGEQGPLAPWGPKTVLGKMMLKVGNLRLDQCLAKNQCSG